MSTGAIPFYYAGEVLKVRITKENIDQFRIWDTRTENIDYINDRKALEKKLVNYEKGVKDELTLRYPGRYDLTVLTYSQYEDPYLIIDGCHRIEAMRKVLLPEGLVDGFDFWLIPTNILIPQDWGKLSEQEKKSLEEDAFRLNEMVNTELKIAGLPLWVKKFEFAKINGELVAWKNINIIDTGDITQPLQFGVDWWLNLRGINFAQNKELKDLPRYRDLIK